MGIWDSLKVQISTKYKTLWIIENKVKGTQFLSRINDEYIYGLFHHSTPFLRWRIAINKRFIRINQTRPMFKTMTKDVIVVASKNVSKLIKRFIKIVCALTIQKQTNKRTTTTHSNGLVVRLICDERRGEFP